MNWHHISDKTQKARKQYVCTLCGQYISAGTQYVNRFGFSDCEPLRMTMHAPCEAITQSWDKMDWETFMIGDGDWPKYDENGNVVKEQQEVGVVK